jgi:Dyp-type peroxidase family
LLSRRFARKASPDYEKAREELQGIVLHGYKHMEAACFLLLKIENARQGGQWLRELLPELTTAAARPREARYQQQSCVNLAFTWRGLEALGLESGALATFPFEFRQGMARRARVLGDVGGSGPERWEFGGTQPGTPGQDELHVLLMLYAHDAESLSPVLAHHRERLKAHGLVELYCQQGGHMKDEEGFFTEHFGFRDSLSQPRIAGFSNPDAPANDYDSAVAAGEIILGYENEYQEMPDSPRISEHLAEGSPLEKSEVDGYKDLGRNGTYLVLRKLHQDVDAFNAFLEQHREIAPCPTGNPERQKDWLKAKLIGRWPNGAPLKPGQTRQPRWTRKDSHGIANDFDFSDDTAGKGCPLTSHVRRANPRDSLPPGRKLSMQVSRRHRILRRGIPYAKSAGGTREQGLLFVGLNANLARQFEFIQQSWMNNEKAGGLYDERDPVTSSQDSGRLTIAAPGLRKSVTGIHQFVTTKGGGYFFLPGTLTLQFLADTALRHS